MTAPNIDGYSLWLEPDAGSRSILQKIINDLTSLEPSSPTFPPHVTLLHPIPLDLTSETLISLIGQALSKSKVRKLELTLQPARHGESYYQSVLSPVDAQPDLMALRTACQSSFDVSPTKAYFPHLSLQYGSITENRRQELASLVNESSPFPVTIRFTHITIMSTIGSAEEWRKVGTVAIDDHLN